MTEEEYKKLKKGDIVRWTHTIHKGAEWRLIRKCGPNWVGEPLTPIAKSECQRSHGWDKVHCGKRGRIYFDFGAFAFWELVDDFESWVREVRSQAGLET